MVNYVFSQIAKNQSPKMKSVFAISIILLWITPSMAQIVHKIEEKYIVERTIGQRAFFQADINGDGAMDFLADANNGNHAIIGKISGNDIQVDKFFEYPDNSNAVRMSCMRIVMVMAKWNFTF